MRARRSCRRLTLPSRSRRSRCELRLLRRSPALVCRARRDARFSGRALRGAGNCSRLPPHCCAPPRTRPPRSSSLYSSLFPRFSSFNVHRYVVDCPSLLNPDASSVKASRIGLPISFVYHVDPATASARASQSKYALAAPAVSPSDLAELSR